MKRGVPSPGDIEKRREARPRSVPATAGETVWIARATKKAAARGLPGLTLVCGRQVRGRYVCTQVVCYDWQPEPVAAATIPAGLVMEKPGEYRWSSYSIARLRRGELPKRRRRASLATPAERGLGLPGTDLSTTIETVAPVPAIIPCLANHRNLVDRIPLDTDVLPSETQNTRSQ